MDQFLADLGGGLVARLAGPGRGRFLMQPLVAIALGIRDGIEDAKQGKPPYFIRVVFKSERKGYVLKSGLKNIATPLCSGIALDIVLQWVIFHAVRLLPALVAGTILVAFPYALARGLSNRVATRWYSRHSNTEAMHTTAGNLS